MYEVIVNIIGVTFITLINIYIWSKLLRKIPNWKIIRTYFLIIGLILVMFFNYYYGNNFLKILFITLIMMAFCKLIFNVNVNKAIVTPLVSQFIIMIAEFIFSLFVLVILEASNQQVIDNYFGSILTNFTVSILAFILIKFKFPYKLHAFLIKITSKINKYELSIFSIILIISVNLIEMIIYYKVDMIWLIIVNTSLIVIYSLIIFKMANTKNEYLNISDKYNNSKNSLIEYQSVINRYKIDNHENKNQLKILKGKINKDNKIAIDYIDTILNTRIKNNDKLLNKAKIIPKSDLRTLIDSKIMTMDDLKIKCNLHVDKHIKTINLIDINFELMSDICKILGVYLDNAIEAVCNLENRQIEIDFYYISDKLHISIANNFDGNIEIDKFDKLGYSTKGNNRGFGLPMAKEIINNNENLENQRIVNNNIFKQILIIKNI